MSEYDDYLAKYGAPTSAADTTGFSHSLALMAGDRVLGNNVYGKGIGDQARALASAASPQAAATVDPAANLRSKLFADAKSQYQKALQANIDAENEIKAGYKSRRERALATLGKISDGAGYDINRHFDQLAAETRSKANSSGLGQSTILTTSLQGIERERAKALAAAGDVRAQREVGYDSQLSGDELGFQERVSNEYPDMSNMLALAQLEGKGTQAGINPNAYGPAGGGGFVGGYGPGAMYGFGGVPGFGWQQPTAAPKAQKPLHPANQSAPLAAMAQYSLATEPQMGWPAGGAVAAGGAPAAAPAAAPSVGWTNPFGVGTMPGAPVRQTTATDRYSRGYQIDPYANW